MPSPQPTTDEIMKLSNNIEIREKLIDALRDAERRLHMIRSLRNSLQTDTPMLEREKVIDSLNEILREGQ